MIKYNNTNDSERKVDQNEVLQKLLGLSLELGSSPDKRNEFINKYEETTRQMDRIAQDKYISELKNLQYNTLTLEEEKDKLEKNISFIKNRLDQRRELLDSYRRKTHEELKDLPEIEDADRLQEYQTRLRGIEDYLNNSVKIEATKTEVAILNEELKRENSTKANNEKRNIELEKELQSSFFNAINDLQVVINEKELNIGEYLKDCDVDFELEKIQDSDGALEISKKAYEIYLAAYDQVRKSGRDDPLFGEGLRERAEEYYSNKEQEYILKIYDVVSKDSTDYAGLYLKREKINDILNERTLLRNKLSINSLDVLTSFYSTLSSEENEISNQKENIDNIGKIEARLNFKNDKLRRLEEDNNRPEILALLKEFCLIETSELENVSEEVTPVVEEVKEQVDNNQFEPTAEMNSEELEKILGINSFKKAEEIKKYRPNQIKSVRDTELLNKVQTKANNVMKRVCEVVGTSIKKEVPIEETPKQESVIVPEKLDIVQEQPIVANTIEAPAKSVESILSDLSSPIEATPKIESINNVPTVSEIPKVVAPIMPTIVPKEEQKVEAPTIEMPNMEVKAEPITNNVPFWTPKAPETATINNVTPMAEVSKVEPVGSNLFASDNSNGGGFDMAFPEIDKPNTKTLKPTA